MYFKTELSGVTQSTSDTHNLSDVDTSYDDTDTDYFTASSDSILLSSETRESSELLSNEESNGFGADITLSDINGENCRSHHEMVHMYDNNSFCSIRIVSVFKLIMMVYSFSRIAECQRVTMSMQHVFDYNGFTSYLEGIAGGNKSRDH